MTQQEVIKTFVKALNNTQLSGRAALDAAVQACSDFESYKALVEQFKADVEASGDNWQRFLIEKCGIILENEDTGALIGSDAGGDSVKTDDNILPADGDPVYPESSEFTVDGLTIYGVPDRNSLTEQEQLVVQGLYSWWIRDSLNLIKETYGLTLDEEGVTNRRMKLQLYNDPDSAAMAAVRFEDAGDGMKAEISTLRINMSVFENITKDNVHGYVAGLNDSLDRTLAHELTHTLMTVNMNYFQDLPHWFTEGTAELIVGIDKARKDEFGTFLTDRREQLFNMLDTNVIGSNYPYAVYTGGVIFLRYLAKQAGDQIFDYDTFSDNVTVENGFALNYFDTVSVTGSSDADTIFNTGYNATINADAGNDSIINYYTALVNGEGGGDKLENYGDNATLNGGKGNDTVLNDATGASVNGGNGDAGADTIINTGKNVTIVGGNGNDTVFNDATGASVNGGNGDDEISNSGTNNSVDGGAGDDEISNSGTNNSVDGGAGDDEISNSGANNTIRGGEGNDTITNVIVESTFWNNSPHDNIINGDDGDDFIEDRSHYNSTVDGGNGNDSIRILSGLTTIFGGDGDDSILNEGFISNINAGDGNDLIRNSGDYATLSGGAGSDTFAINDGVGVLVTDFNPDEDAISIAAGGASVVNADGSIEINFKNPVETIESGADDSAQLKVIKKFMASLDQSELSGRAAIDEAVRASSDFGSYGELSKQFLSDIQACKGNWNKFLQQYCGIFLKNADTGAISGSDAGGSKVITSDNIFDPVEGTLEYPEGDSFTVGGVTVYGIPDRDSLNEQQQLVVKALYNYWIKNALDLIKNSFGLTFNEEGTNNHRLRLIFMNDSSSGILVSAGYDDLNGNGKNFGGIDLTINMAYFEDFSEDNLIDNNIHRTLAHELVHTLMSTNFNYFSDLPNWFAEGSAELIHGIDDDRDSKFSMMFRDSDVSEGMLQLEYSGSAAPTPVYTGGYIFLRYLAHQAAGANTVAAEDGYLNNFSDGETLKVSADVSTIENAGNDVEITLNGSGLVYNYGANAVIVGSDSVDTILNHNEISSVDGGNGNDIVYGDFSKSTLNGGAGDDSITNYGALSFICGGADNDTINNNIGSIDYFTVVATKDGAPEFPVTSSIISGANSTVDGGAGDDLIYNQVDNALIFGGAGNDTLQNEIASFKIYVDGDIQTTMHACVNPTLDGGSGNDHILNTLDSVWLYGGYGNDSVTNSGDEVLIYGDNGDDTIRNIGAIISINGGFGDDLIQNSGVSITIDGGIGEDTLINEGRKVSLNGGAGNDVLRSSGDHATLVGGAGSDTFVVTDGAGAVIYDFNADEDIISIGSGVSGVTTLNNTVESEEGFLTVDGNLNNFENETALIGGANADSIINNGWYMMVESGGGNDSIRNEGYGSELNAGAGADFILSNGDRATLTGGAGADTFVVNDGTGVVIVDYNADEDMISLASGASSILNDDGMIEITVANPVEPVDSTEYTPQIGVFKRLMASLDKTTLSGVDALDEAINAASDGNVENYQAFVNQFRADLISCGGNGQRFLLEYCGINLFNEDTGAITGADAGGTLKAESDLIDVSGEANYPSSDTFTVDGLTLYGIPDRSSLTDAQQTIVRGLCSWWLDGSLDLINQSYGLTFNEEGTGNHRMRFMFDDVDELWKAAVQFSTDTTTGDIIILQVNMHYFDSISADDRHGANDVANLDQIILHEMTHAAMVTNIENYGELPTWFAAGSAELIRGIDTSGNRRPLVIQYANDGNALIDMLTNEEPEDVYVNYAGSYIAMRYMAKQFSGQTFDYDEYRPTIKGNDQLNYFDDVKMIGASKADTIVNVGGEVSINAKGGNDYIISTGEDVTIKTGTGNDTISIEGGSAWIKDYSARKDTLLLADGASTVKSHGGILVTFDETAAQLAALADVEPTVDELNEIMTPTEIAICTYEPNICLNEMPFAFKNDLIKRKATAASAKS